MTINICFATDKNYLAFMATAMVSILKTAAPNDAIHFYILCNSIPNEQKEYLQQLRKFKDFKLSCIDLDMEEFKNFPAGGAHITNTTYFRYKIAELCPDIEKIIYLDCDTIVTQSLAELFNQDLTGYYLAGVEDVGYYYWKNYNPQFLYKDGFYINAGMLLINLDQWRKNNLFHKLVDFTIQNEKNIAIGDQDVINRVCLGKIKRLDYKWNVQDSFYRAEPERAFNPYCEEIIKAAENPAIIHYTQAKKPWNNVGMPRAEDWIKFNCIRLGPVKGMFYKIKISLRKLKQAFSIHFYLTDRGININLFGFIKTKILPFPLRKK